MWDIVDRIIHPPVHDKCHRRLAVEFENSMLTPTVHDDRYDSPCMCETCIHENECLYEIRNCEDYEEE